MPIRIQRKRVKGWRMPENTVYVGRPSKFGNIATCTPHGCLRKPCDCCDAYRCCVNVFETWIMSGIDGRTCDTGALSVALDAMTGFERRDAIIRSLPELTAKNLACWCPVISHDTYSPCHADVLLSLANDIPFDEVIYENIRWAKRETL